MFSKLRLSDGNFQLSTFKRLDLVEAEKTPPVDPHSLEVLRDGVPRFLAPVASRRLPGRRVLWRKGDR
jgi:hypothetical protein